MPSLEPAVVHDDLVSQDGALLGPESSMGTDGIQQPPASEGSKVTLLLKLVPQEAVL